MCTALSFDVYIGPDTTHLTQQSRYYRDDLIMWDGSLLVQWAHPTQ